MTAKLFAVLLFLPSLFFVMAILATFYGIMRAYLGVACVTLACYGVLRALQAVLSFGHADDRVYDELLTVVAWTSLAQALLGAALLVRACVRRKGRLLMLAALCVACAPFLLRI